MVIINKKAEYFNLRLTISTVCDSLRTGLFVRFALRGLLPVMECPHRSPGFAGNPQRIYYGQNYYGQLKWREWDGNNSRSASAKEVNSGFNRIEP